MTKPNRCDISVELRTEAPLLSEDELTAVNDRLAAQLKKAHRQLQDQWHEEVLALVDEKMVAPYVTTGTGTTANNVTVNPPRKRKKENAQ